MYPEIIRIGDFVISSFGVMLVAAFLTCNILLRRELKSWGKEPSLADEFTFNAALGGILGSKVYYILENIPSGEGLDNLLGLWHIVAGIFTLNGGKIADGIQNFGAGMVFYGGLLGGFLAILLFVRKHKLNTLTVADWVAPYLALGQGIGRIGCFLVGDDYGRTTNLPWGIAFPNGSPPIDVPVHPTQLYEMSAYVLIYFYLIRKRKDSLPNGSLMWRYMLLLGSARFLIEFIRVNPQYLLGLTGAQFVSLGLIITGVIMLYRQRTLVSSTTGNGTD